MLFNSLDFLLFIIPVVVLFWLVPSKYNWVIIFLASNIFVGLIGYESLLILYFVSFISFLGGLYLDRIKSKKKRKITLFISLGTLIALLSYYKYSLFFSAIFDLFNIEINRLNFKNIILPLGISFYTFQAIGYVLAIYRGQIKSESRVVHFLNYLFYFPKLLSGPIEKAESFLPQLTRHKKFSHTYIIDGSKLFILGLFKKLVIADRIGIYVDSVYTNYPNHSSITLIITAVLYVFQIYSDFSGYTDMARGVSKFFGYDLMENFRQPILAQNISNFWRRWHISLTNWATDNIYYPIVVKRRDWGNYGVLYATFFTFLLIGIWHGATINFVIFGLLQVFLVYSDFALKKIKKKTKSFFRNKKISIVYNMTSWFVTFIIITYSMIIFRIDSLNDLLSINKIIFSFRGSVYLGTLAYFLYAFLGVFIILILDIWKEFYSKNFLFKNSKSFVLRQSPFLFFLILILLLGVFDGGQFIYFQF